MDTHIPILTRAGIVLVVLGTLDVTVQHGTTGMLAAAAGGWLMCGSLRAAAIVRCCAAFCLCAYGVFALAWPLMQPVGLTLAQLRLQPRVFPTLAMTATLLLLLHWIYRTLGAPAVLAAQAAAGRTPRYLKQAAAGGAAMSLLVCATLVLQLRGEAADSARRAAERQLGPDYRYHVAALRVSQSGGGRQVEGLVMAWNGTEIRSIPVAWSESASGGR